MGLPEHGDAPPERLPLSTLSWELQQALPVEPRLQCFSANTCILLILLLFDFEAKAASSQAPSDSESEPEVMEKMRMFVRNGKFCNST